MSLARRFEAIARFAASNLDEEGACGRMTIVYVKTRMIGRP